MLLDLESQGNQGLIDLLDIPSGVFDQLVHVAEFVEAVSFDT